MRDAQLEELIAAHDAVLTPCESSQAGNVVEDRSSSAHARTLQPGQDRHAVVNTRP
jgi:hypothetical protein